jgi:hypothetical protein
MSPHARDEMFRTSPLMRSACAHNVQSEDLNQVWTKHTSMWLLIMFAERSLHDDHVLPLE